MATTITEQGPSAPAFDAAAWFAAWSDHGGIAMLLGDRLWIGRWEQASALPTNVF